MRNGSRSGFLGIVNEVPLGIILGVFANDLDGILVRAHGAIRTQAVKHGTDNTLRFNRELRIVFQAGLADVVLYAHREVNFGPHTRQIVVHRFHHGRREFFGGEAITAANNPGEGFQATVAFVHAFVQSVHNIEVQRFTTTAGLFSPVQHRDVADAHLCGTGRADLDELLGKSHDARSSCCSIELSSVTSVRTWMRPAITT